MMIDFKWSSAAIMTYTSLSIAVESEDSTRWHSIVDRFALVLESAIMRNYPILFGPKVMLLVGH